MNLNNRARHIRKQLTHAQQLLADLPPDQLITRITAAQPGITATDPDRPHTNGGNTSDPTSSTALNETDAHANGHTGDQAAHDLAQLGLWVSQLHEAANHIDDLRRSWLRPTTHKSGESTPDIWCQAFLAHDLYEPAGTTTPRNPGNNLDEAIILSRPAADFIRTRGRRPNKTECETFVTRGRWPRQHDTRRKAS